MIGYFTVHPEKWHKRKDTKQKKVHARNALQKLVRLNTQLFAIVQPFTEQIQQVLMGSPTVVLKAYEQPRGIPIGKTEDNFYTCIDAEPISIQQLPENSQPIFFPVWDFELCDTIAVLEPPKALCEKWLNERKLYSLFKTEEGVHVAIVKGFLPESEEAPGVVAGTAGIYYRMLPGKSVTAGLRKLVGDVHKNNPRIALLPHSTVQMLQLAEESQTITDTVRHATQLQDILASGKWKEALEKDPSLIYTVYPNLITVGALAPIAAQIETDIQSIIHAEPELIQGTEAIAKLLHTSLHTGLMPIAETVFVEPPQTEKENQTWRRYKIQSAIAAAYKYGVSAQRSLFSRKMPFQLHELLQQSEPAFESLFVTTEDKLQNIPMLQKWMQAGGKIATLTMSAITNKGERKQFQILMPFVPGLFLFSTLSQPRDTMSDFERSLVPRVLQALENFPTQRNIPTETVNLLKNLAKTIDWTMGYKTIDAIAQTIASNAFYMGGFNMQWWQENPTPEKEKLRILQQATSWPRSFYDIPFLAEIAGNMLTYGADKPNNQQIIELMSLAPILQMFRFEQPQTHIPNEWANANSIFAQHAWDRFVGNIKNKTPEQSLEILAHTIAPKLQSIGVEAIFAQIKIPSGKWKAFYLLPRGNIGVYEQEGKVFVSAKTENTKLHRFYQREIQKPSPEQEVVIAYLDPRKVKPFPTTALEIIPAEKMPFPPSQPATFGIKYQIRQDPNAWKDVLNAPITTQMPAVVANLISLLKNWTKIAPEIVK